jgi:hypothetical protein
MTNPAAQFLHYKNMLDIVHYLKYTQSLGSWLSSCPQVDVIIQMDLFFGYIDTNIKPGSYYLS